MTTHPPPTLVAIPQVTSVRVHARGSADFVALRRPPVSSLVGLDMSVHVRGIGWLVAGGRRGGAARASQTANGNGRRRSCEGRRNRSHAHVRQVCATCGPPGLCHVCSGLRLRVVVIYGWRRVTRSVSLFIWSPLAGRAARESPDQPHESDQGQGPSVIGVNAASCHASCAFALFLALLRPVTSVRLSKSLAFARTGVQTA